jgi:hypothetical protein
MIIREIGKAFEKANEKIDQVWTKMSEDLAKFRKEAKVRQERLPEVYGNQTDAALREDLQNTVKGIPATSETLASAAADREHKGKWQKV